MNLKFFFFLSSIVLVLGSTGDRLQSYKDCLESCVRVSDPPSALSLRVMLWSKEDDCRYTCMHNVSDLAVRDGKRIHQFHGKWPFYRWAGMQEPASVLFSILNGYMHYKGSTKYARRIGPEYFLRPVLIVYGFVSVNTWIWSAVFHCRDLPITEKARSSSLM